MDGDGDMDFVTTLGLVKGIIPTDYHHISWYENNLDEAKTWNKHYVSRLDYAFDVDVGDIDNDGTLEIVVTAHESKGSLIVFDKTKSGWQKITLRDNWPAVNRVHLNDIDGDGDLDITATADTGNRISQDGQQSLVWWRNNIQ